MTSQPLSRSARVFVLVAASLGLVFDGIELGLMPVASLSVSKSLLGDAFTPTLGGDWFARFTAALMLGAAVGGVLLGNLGDRIGRSRAMGVSILFYSIFALMGAWVRTQEEMLVLRFLVGLGVGGVWPNGMALVAECWSNASRPLVTGVMSAGLNAGILLLSQVVRIWTVNPDSWRWLFYLGGLPALLGILVLIALPESPTWLANRNVTKQPPPPIRELFRPGLIRITLVAIIIASIPLVGAWSASKWMIPWADKIAGVTSPGYKATTQGWWALGATFGSFFGAQLSRWMGRRTSYLLISLFTTILTLTMFQWTEPLQPSFHPIVFAQGLCRNSVLRMACRLPAPNVSYSRTGHWQRFSLQFRAIRNSRGCVDSRISVCKIGRRLLPSWCDVFRDLCSRHTCCLVVAQRKIGRRVPAPMNCKELAWDGPGEERVSV
jgi:MFS family permease